MKYLKGIKRVKITLRADSLSIIKIKWWADAEFASHHDCRGCSGGMVSLGAGAVISKSMKQRINGKSSTNNETITVDKVMGLVPKDMVSLV